MVDVSGTVVPPGKSVRNPGLVGRMAMTFKATAVAVEGIPHWPLTTKVRSAPAGSEWTAVGTGRVARVDDSARRQRVEARWRDETRGELGRIAAGRRNLAEA
jgi:hypothetical protein